MAENLLLELAKRCERAEGPDRELDEAIYRDVLGFCLHPIDRLERTGAQSDTGFDCLDCGADSWGNKGKHGERLHDRAPAYTASLDAALTLVPEGWGYRFEFHPDLVVRHYATIWSPADDEAGRGRNKATLALALTAACLRARPSKQDARP